MNAVRKLVVAVGTVGCFISGLTTRGQVVINEMVDDERSSGSGQVRPDTREFVELFNAGQSAVDISGWTLNVVQIGLNPGPPVAYTIPGSTSIAPGDYYVVGAPSVANVNFSPAGAINDELFPDDAAGGASTNEPNHNFILELRNGATLVDALATETFRDPERENLTPEQLAQVGGGWWGQTISMNQGSLNPLPQSVGRYLDGRDRDVNGLDFGMLPITPGASNNLPQNQSHTIPNVDGMATETALHDNYYASFIAPRVVNPAVADGIVNQVAIPASPQGGEAIMAYDESGGGNASYSKELVNEFDLYAYIETGDLNVATGTTVSSEASIYGIGTTDAFFGTPNSAGLLTVASTQNSSSGYGWQIQRAESIVDGSPVTRTVLQLIDFHDGGDSLPEDGEWQVIRSIELTGTESDWHRLGIEYDPSSGAVTATHNTETITFTVTGDYNNNGTVDAADYVVWRENADTNNTLPNNPLSGPIGQAHYEQWSANFGRSSTPGLVGNFYVGYRENLGGALGTARPPTYDVIGVEGAAAGPVVGVPEPGTMVLLAAALASIVLWRR
jgi:hypothetical protein